MIKIFDKDFDINKILSREIQSYGEYEESVRQIVADVMTGGDAAVKKYTRKFDGVSVDGEHLYEPYAVEQMREFGDYDYPFQVPEGKIFVMGDNKTLQKLLHD